MDKQQKGINTFQRYLSVWVLLCMAIGVLIGHFLPIIPNALDRLQISGISIPIAVLIWVMIYPMMMKVDFQSVKQVGKNPKGLFITWITNWLIKPFTMYGIAYLFLFVVFKAFIAPELATEYRSSWRGAVYGDGLCLEHTDKGKSCLHRGPGGYE